MYTRDRSPLDTIHLPLLLRDLFILASVFLAAKPMRERPVICDLENMFFDDEAFRRLLSIAAILRAKYDWHDSVPPRPEWDPKDLSIMDCAPSDMAGRVCPSPTAKRATKSIFPREQTTDLQKFIQSKVSFPLLAVVFARQSMVAGVAAKPNLWLVA
jgi:hypothetical protein